MGNYTIWGALGPIAWPWWLTALGIICRLAGGRFERFSHILFAAGLILFLLFAVVPTGHWLCRALETRHRAPDLDRLSVDHIIVLSGGVDPDASAVARRPQLNASGDRLLEGATLARVYPNAKLWIVGGVKGRWARTDADWSRLLWEGLGVPRDRIVVVNGSRNTWENARDVAARRPAGTLLLLTSATHMPRSVASFEAFGLAVEPYPSDFLTGPSLSVRHILAPPILANLTHADRALHEWVGLLVYRLSGRTRTLLPPRDADRG